ncbi:MAG: hypothetical protein MJA31_06340 [Clostridia bacterium]|nr:hypothetical protein [Clostridia bacterium]
MRKKVVICVYIFVLILLIGLITGCGGKEEEEKSERGAPDLPASFDQLQELSDEIVTKTMAKGWAESLDNVKEFQSAWADLYPDLEKQGVSETDVDAFVKDLNILSDLLISKTLNLPQKPPEKPSSQEEEKKPEEDSGQEQEKESESGGGQEGGEQEGGEGDTKKDAQKEEEKQKQEPESGGQQEEQDSEQSSMTEEKKDPKKVLEEIDPILSATNEELIIVNAAVEVTQHIPKFMTSFKNPVPPDMYKLKYLVRHLDVASKLGDWETASGDMTSLSTTWSSLQPSAVEADPDLKIQLNQSIEEMKDVITSKNANLTGIKSKLVIEHIDALVKKMKEAEEKEKEKEE